MMITLKKPHGELQISEFMSWANSYYFRVHGDGTVTKILPPVSEYLEPRAVRLPFDRAFYEFGDMTHFKHITKEEYEKQELITINHITNGGN